MTDAIAEGMNHDSVLFLLSLFEEHKIHAVCEDGWVVLTDYDLRASCAVFNLREPSNGKSLQLDVCIEIGMGRALIESFGGIGGGWEEALADAGQNFISNSFHVILAAFFTEGYDEQISRETWEIDGVERTVILGNIGLRGSKAAEANTLPLDWFEAFEQKIKERPLDEGSHWIRLYYAHLDNKTIACEVLLDNETWDELQDEMADFDWPERKDFYSVRLFLIVTE